MNHNRAVFNIGPNEIVAETIQGNYLVVPGFNVDVGIGIIRDGVIEPWTTNIVGHILKPGDEYINVGANFGYYTALGAQLVGRTGKVYAIEANPHVFIYLVKSMYWSGYPDVISAYHLAAWSIDDEEMTIVFDPQYIGGGGIHPNVSVPTQELQECFWDGDKASVLSTGDGMFKPIGFFSSATVKTKRIDSIIPDGANIKLLQMDIEGAEVEAIFGAKQLISNNKVLDIIIEWDSRRVDQRAMECIHFLAGCGYSFFKIEVDNFQGLNSTPIIRRLNIDMLDQTGHCELLVTRNPSFHATII